MAKMVCLFGGCSLEKRKGRLITLSTFSPHFNPCGVPKGESRNLGTSDWVFLSPVLFSRLKHFHWFILTVYFKAARYILSLCMYIKEFVLSMAVCFILNYSAQLLFDFNSKSLVQTLWHPNSIASQRVILRGICIVANKLLKAGSVSNVNYVY